MNMTVIDVRMQRGDTLYKTSVHRILCEPGFKFKPYRGVFEFLTPASIGFVASTPKFSAYPRGRTNILRTNATFPNPTRQSGHSWLGTNLKHRCSFRATSPRRGIPIGWSVMLRGLIENG